MNKITADQILAHMRQLSDAAKGSSVGESSAVTNGQFANVLGDALNKVNELQKASGQAQANIVSGDGGVSLVKAMIASQKSSVAFDAAVQVRNRVVSAYQDIMNMPI